MEAIYFKDICEECYIKNYCMWMVKEYHLKNYNGNFICQAIVSQCTLLNSFNEKVLNTVRVISFLYKGNAKI